MQTATWGQEEFGTADLGDKRLNERLVLLAQGFADRPGGKLTKVLPFGAEQHGGYRFMENAHVSSDEMERARGESCARRLAGSAIAIVPIDQTSINLPEQRKTTNFGSVGTRSSGARGVHVMTALALDEGTVTSGVLYQDSWIRSEERTPPRSKGRNGKRKDKRAAEQRESYAWIRALDGCEAQLLQSAPEVQPWYQLDQGGDFWRVFDWANQHDALLTARVGHERVIYNGTHRNHLRPWIEGRQVAYRYDLELPERTGSDSRDARTAHLSVRFGTTEVQFYSTRTKTTRITLTAIAVTEPRPPQGAEPIDWLLLTTFPVVDNKDAELVIQNYTLRWRCEEFHRTLKTGACNIEQSEMQTFENFRRLLVLESSVAARIERIKFLSRTQPEAPATVAYTREEIDLLIRLRQQHMPRKKPGYRPTQTPPLGIVTSWVAELGGFIPSRSRGYPGTIVLARGLAILRNALLGARAVRKAASGCG